MGILSIAPNETVPELYRYIHKTGNKELVGLRFGFEIGFALELPFFVFVVFGAFLDFFFFSVAFLLLPSSERGSSHCLGEVFVL